MSILESIQQRLNEAVQKFAIPPAIAKNYRITGDLSNVKSWQAKTILANNGGNKGKYAPVGYVAISPDSNLIVPISRNDEHQNGYEFLVYLIDKKLIPDEDFITMYMLTEDYVYDEKDRKRKLKIYKKYLDYGGNPNLHVGSMDNKYKGNVQDFVNRKGNVTFGKGDLAVGGKDIIQSLEYIAKEYSRLRDIAKKFREPKETDIQELFKFTIQFVEKFDDIFQYYRLASYGKFPDKYIEKLIVELLSAQAKDDYEKLAQLILSMNGLKNYLHLSIKHLLKNKDDYAYRYYQEIFGNVETAFLELNRLGDI